MTEPYGWDIILDSDLDFFTKSRRVMEAYARMAEASQTQLQIVPVYSEPVQERDEAYIKALAREVYGEEAALLTGTVVSVPWSKLTEGARKHWYDKARRMVARTQK